MKSWYGYINIVMARILKIKINGGYQVGDQKVVPMNSSYRNQVFSEMSIF